MAAKIPLWVLDPNTRLQPCTQVTATRSWLQPKSLIPSDSGNVPPPATCPRVYDCQPADAAI